MFKIDWLTIFVAMILLSVFFVDMVLLYVILLYKVHTNLWINQFNWHLQHIKPGIFESCQNLTTKSKVKFECVIFLNINCPWESELKLIAKINKHTWKHGLKYNFCCHSTFSECLQLKVSTIFWINQSCWQFNISNLTLYTVIKRWNLRVASTLQHRWRSNLMVWSFNQILS